MKLENDSRKIGSPMATVGNIELLIKLHRPIIKYIYYLYSGSTIPRDHRKKEREREKIKRNIQRQRQRLRRDEDG